MVRHRSVSAAAVLWVLWAVGVDAGQAGGVQPAAEVSPLVVLVPILIGFLIVAAVFLVWNSVMAWIASKIMTFDHSSFGRAVRFTLTSILLPIPLAILAALAVWAVTGAGLFAAVAADQPGLAGVPTVVCVIGVIVFFLVLPILIAKWVYRVGFIRAVIFQVVLFCVNVGVALVLSMMLGGLSALLPAAPAA